MFPRCVSIPNYPFHRGAANVMYNFGNLTLTKIPISSIFYDQPRPLRSFIRLGFHTPEAFLHSYHPKKKLYFIIYFNYSSIELTAPWNKMFAFLNIFDLDLVCGIFARLTTILKQQLLFSFNLRTQRRKVFQPSFLFSCQSERLFGGKSKKAGGPFCHYWGQLKSLLSSFLYDQTLKALTRLYLAELHKELRVFSCF